MKVLNMQSKKKKHQRNEENKRKDNKILFKRKSNGVSQRGKA